MSYESSGLGFTLPRVGIVKARGSVRATITPTFFQKVTEARAVAKAAPRKLNTFFQNTASARAAGKSNLLRMFERGLARRTATQLIETGSGPAATPIAPAPTAAAPTYYTPAESTPSYASSDVSPTAVTDPAEAAPTPPTINPVVIGIGLLGLLFVSGKLKHKR